MKASVVTAPPVTSQLPVERWHEIIGDPAIADAVLDRTRASYDLLPFQNCKRAPSTNAIQGSAVNNSFFVGRKKGTQLRTPSPHLWPAKAPS